MPERYFHSIDTLKVFPLFSNSYSDIKTISNLECCKLNNQNQAYFWKKTHGCIFAEKLVLEKGKVSAPVFTEPIQLIFRISEVLRRSEKNKEVDLNQSLVATLTKNLIFKI